MLSRRKVLFCLFFLLVSSILAYAERVISPVSGTFANKQALVLDLSDGAEAFYSFTECDPLDSGLIYEGPVLLDMTGNLSLKVAVIKDGKKEAYEVNYTVSETNPFFDGSQEHSFIEKISSEGFLLYQSSLVIPQSLSFSFGNGDRPFLRGTNLSLSPKNALSRYLPCCVTDGSSSWRFIVLVQGESPKTDYTDPVPFEISDWNHFRFFGKDLIWRIDGGYWSASDEEIEIDRSVEHEISWQSVIYQEGNPVATFILPPVPKLFSSETEDGAYFYFTGDERYEMKILSGGSDGECLDRGGMFRSVFFDTFEGDSIDSVAEFAFYCDGVYQGNLSVPYAIDKDPPLPPKFMASEPGEYARKDIVLSLSSEKKSSIFVSISNSDESSPFVLYDSKPIVLRSLYDKPVTYVVQAYSEDSFGNRSALSFYKVTIDDYNFFIDPLYSLSDSDGSSSRPFNSLSQALKVLGDENFVRFFVKGFVEVPPACTEILSNCSFTGLGDARLVFQPDSFLSVKNSILEFKNLIIEKNCPETEKSLARIFSIENSSVSFENCEILSDTASSGNVFSVKSSVLSLKNSGLVSKSRVYSCAVSAIDSEVSVLDSHISSISGTAVNFSLSGGTFALSSCDCGVTSHLGRIIESGGANIRLSGNKYTGDFDEDARERNALWADEKSLILEDKNNISIGFSYD